MKETKEAVVVIEKESEPIQEDLDPDFKHAQKQENPDLLDPNKPIGRSLFFFLLPLIASNVLQSLGGTVSSIVVGRGLGESALATVNIVLPLIFFLHSFVIGIGGASSVLIGQAFGAKDRERIRSIVHTSLTFSFFLGLLLGSIGVLFAPQLLMLMQTPASIMEEATLFARIEFVFLPIIFVYIIYTTFLRGTGDSKTPFYFLLVSTLINIFLAPIFALGWFGMPMMGAKGIALAISLSHALTLIILLVYLKRTRHLLAADSTLFTSFKLDLTIIKLLIRIGLPTGIQMILISLSQVAVVHLVNEYGIQATAAYGAIVQVVSYVQMPALSLGMAVGIFGSQLIGAQRNERLPELLKSGVWLNYVIGILLVGMVYLFRHSILSLFLVEHETLKLAEQILFLILWSYLLFGNNLVIAGMMRSSGTVLWPTVIGVFSIWCIQLPVAYWLSKTVGWGLKGIWMAYPIHFGCTLVMQYLYYRLRWKTKQHRDLFAQQG